MPARIRRHVTPSLPSTLDRDRGSAARRGYNRRWARYRMVYLRQHPICVACGAVANEVDHVQRVVRGQNDPLFWVESNHQALCKRCHSRKTASEVLNGPRSKDNEYNAS